ncbi:YbaK/EbsC family protein [Rhodobacteraceae bacterium CCMM004]|nr:YbaK/EbsC family protein [Rhodobacteraceae bacterium CCMM004]
MSKSLARVRAALDAAGLDTQVLEMPDETRTAAQAAAAAGCALDQIAKSIVMGGTETGRAYLFLTAGGNRVDPDRAAALAGEPLGRADAGRVRAETGFAIGGVAPVGHLSPLPVFADPRLTEFAVVWAAGGTPRHVFAIAPADLIRVSGAQVHAFAVPADEM